MDTAERIRAALMRVDTFRGRQRADARLAADVGVIKRLQARRFAGSYADLLAQGPYRSAAAFFLRELYGESDFSERDAQFGRVAGTIERVFPIAVAETAAALAELHALTEELDQAMALSWASCSQGATDAELARSYLGAWRSVGRAADRKRQLEQVLELGDDLGRLTRTRGLRTLLRLMRRPAEVAGLTALQAFLETGFDTFGAMARGPSGVGPFLAVVRNREFALMQRLFNDDPVACETTLTDILGQAR